MSALPEEKRAGQTYRLPAEAQWEFAYRAGSDFPYYFDPTKANGYAWTNANARGKTHAVGQLKPNVWGLYDMNGNCWEKCSDSHGENDRVLRGSSLYNDVGLLRTHSPRSRHTFDFGIRVVCTIR
jgi:formylglycine-generating enzyme required for sulfatase activity